MTITKDIRYIGVNDHAVDLFEGQYVVPGGMCYNSYAIVDDKGRHYGHRRPGLYPSVAGQHSEHPGRPQAGLPGGAAHGA